MSGWQSILSIQKAISNHPYHNSISKSMKSLAKNWVVNANQPGSEATTASKK
jgi:hypothetical protein